jgi:hypothetical protein
MFTLASPEVTAVGVERSLTRKTFFTSPNDAMCVDVGEIRKIASGEGDRLETE